MKKRIFRTFAAVCLAAMMLAGTAVTASAANNPYAALEERTRQAVAAAIAEGRVPPGTTIYECAYSKDAAGKTVVVQYMDDSGAWIDVSTAKPAPAPTPTPAPAPAPTQASDRLSEETLAEYVAECYRLVNVEREKAGLAPVSYSEDVAAAALVRAKEIESDVTHTRPDGSKCFTALDDAGIERVWAAENLHRGRSDAARAIQAWMDSDGHRRNMLNEKATAIGIAAYQAENGRICWVQLLIKEN
jgi:uncharacterized protein YkwD